MSLWNKTVVMKKRLDNKLYAENGNTCYQGRPIIHRDSPVDGGVYLGQGSREAIVVDSKKYPLLNKLYEEAKGKVTENGVVQNNKIPQAVYDTVSKHMKYDDHAVELLVIKLGVEHDGKVALDRFIQEGVGVCRHQALACAAIFERFKKDGYLKSEISVDRNSDTGGGHVWCRLNKPNGEKYIIDVAQHYVGSLENAKGKNRWDYERPK